MFDIIIKNGLYFDGTGAEGLPRHVGVKAGKVACVSAQALDEAGCPQVIEAAGHWVMPGFIEPHSHYDAEIIAAPALKESLRHGITTVTIGSCSLSVIRAEARDCSDLFTRVESVPREQVLPILETRKTWRTSAEYRSFYEQHPLGPNVCSFIGHSDIRVAVMGLERATSQAKPTEEELQKMEDMLEEALDAGMIGLSVMTTKLDKVDGERAWSRPLPSTRASWHEFGRLFRILRRRHAILQGAPNAVTKINILAFLWHAHGWFRKPLSISLLTALDLKSQPFLHLMTRFSGWAARTLLRGNFRWQFLPARMQFFADGLDFTNFEEFAHGEKIRDLKRPEEQYALIEDPDFRRRFKKDLNAVLSIGLWHRDFSDAFVVDCPDASLIGKNFADIGQQQGKDGVDAFFDLCLRYREALRWGTVFGNHRVDVMRKLIASRSVQIGFGDSGAHIRMLAFYNFPLQMLRYVRDAELEGKPFISTGGAIHRLTGELADWFGIEAGRIQEGDRADITVINPTYLDAKSVENIEEADMDKLGLTRLVNRNDLTVLTTIVNGRLVYSKDSGFTADLGESQKYGRFLGALHTKEQSAWTASGVIART